MPTNTKQRLSDARKRFQNAVARARYWGNPIGVSRTHSSQSQRDASIEYEMALDDQMAIADEIEKLGGKRPKLRDLKEEDSSTWNAINSALHDKK
tara:strand:+ start:7518 stop:7802 length:285 start_codon:yes stop_codon:yes gene_type:complete